MQEFLFRMPERRHNLDKIVTDIHPLVRHFEQQGDPVVHAVTTYTTHGAGWGPEPRAAGAPEPFR